MRPSGNGGFRSPRLRTLASIVLAALTLVTVLAPATWAAPIPASAVSEKITCQCGCSAVLASCPHEDCGWGVPARLFIEEQLGEGRTPDELIQYYVSQYGEKVLAAPTKRGFNVTAWVTPFIVLVMGAVAIYYLANLWAARRGSPAALALETPAVSDVEDRHLQRLEDELCEFD